MEGTVFKVTYYVPKLELRGGAALRALKEITLDVFVSASVTMIVL